VELSLFGSIAEECTEEIGIGVLNKFYLIIIIIIRQTIINYVKHTIPV